MGAYVGAFADPTPLPNTYPGPSNNDVATTSVSYNALIPNLQLVADLMGGTQTMRAAANRWLPQEAGETKRAYINRLNRSTLYNGFKRAIKTLTGKPFSRPVTLGDDVHPQLVEWWENFDLTGRHGDIFARDIMESVLSDGLAHVMVDYPVTPGPRSLAYERQYNIRPYCVQLDPRNVIAWQSEVRNGVEVPTQVRIRERLIVPDGMWGEKQVVRIRVWFEDHWELWEQLADRGGSNLGWTRVDAGDNTLGKIPIVTLYSRRRSFMMADPPLLDLAFLNIQHWQSGSDQNHVLHVARVPILFGAGFEDPGVEGQGVLEVGPNRFITTSNPQAQLRYVEHGGQAINAGRDDLMDIENRMAVMGAELLVRKPASLTATQVLSDDLAEDSDLSAMVRGVEDGFETIFELMTEWAGFPEGTGGSLTINKDYGITMRDAQDLQILLQSRMAGEITQELFLSELQRRDVIDFTVDIEKEADEARRQQQEANAIEVQNMQKAMKGQSKFAKGGGTTEGGGAGSEGGGVIEHNQGSSGNSGIQGQGSVGE